MKTDMKRLALAGLLAFGMGVSLVGSAPAGTALAGEIGCNSVQENGSGWDGINGDIPDIGGPKQGVGLGSIEQPIPPGNPEGCFGTNGPLLAPIDPTPPPTPKPTANTGVQVAPGPKSTRSR